MTVAAGGADPPAFHGVAVGAHVHGGDLDAHPVGVEGVSGRELGERRSDGAGERRGGGVEFRCVGVVGGDGGLQVHGVVEQLVAGQQTVAFKRVDPVFALLGVLLDHGGLAGGLGGAEIVLVLLGGTGALGTLAQLDQHHVEGIQPVEEFRIVGPPAVGSQFEAGVQVVR